MKKISLFVALMIAIVFACKKSEVQPLDTPAKLVTEEWLKDLQTPWQIVFAKDGRIFFTERAGRVRVVKDGVMSTWLDLTGVVEQGESGLLGIGIDPNFAQNGYVYIAYTYSTPDWKFNNRLVRCVEDKATGTSKVSKITMEVLSNLGLMAKCIGQLAMVLTIYCRKT
jgi:glucose/arabinose dehydrogenase